MSAARSSAVRIVDMHQPSRRGDNNLRCSCGELIAIAGRSPAETGRAVSIHLVAVGIRETERPPLTATYGLTQYADQVDELIGVCRQILDRLPPPLSLEVAIRP